MQPVVDERVSTAFPDHLKVLTDGSVNTRTKAATLAYVIPALDVGHAGRFSVFASTTITELLAMTVALRHLHMRDHPFPVVLLTDSSRVFLQFSNID